MGGGGGQAAPFINLANERVAGSVVQKCVGAICLKHFAEWKCTIYSASAIPP